MIGQPTKGKFLLVGRSIPKEAGGTMIIIKRLLENFSGDEVVVMGRSPYPPNILDNESKLHYSVIEIPFPHWKGFRIWRLLSIPLGIILGVFAILTKKIRVIVGFYPDMGSLSIAYFLSVITGKPLLCYFCDLYAENQKKGFHLWWANWLQPRVFKRAVKVFSVTDGMQLFYKETYGFDVVSLPTAINGTLPTDFKTLPVNGKFIIGYSGSIIKDRIDPMQALTAAIADNDHFEFRMFTPQSEGFLRKNKLWYKNTTRLFCSSRKELIEELSKCHLLYLPLTFKVGGDSNSVPQLATCFGTKCYEYFLSARPILSHCPEEYFTSSFFSENDCGYTLGSMEREQILDKLKEIEINYPTQGRAYVKNAIIVSKRFNGEKLAATFTDAINEAIIS